MEQTETFHHVINVTLREHLWGAHTQKHGTNKKFNESSSVKPPSQSSIVINTQSKISLDSTKVDSVAKGENKNLFKRMTGFFGKVIKNEETPPSGPKS